MAPDIFRKTHEDLIWRSYQKNIFMISDLYGEVL